MTAYVQYESKHDKSMRVRAFRKRENAMRFAARQLRTHTYPAVKISVCDDQMREIESVTLYK